MLVVLIAVTSGMVARDFFCHTGTQPSDFDNNVKRVYSTDPIIEDRVNINTATKADLTVLPGIGDKIAEKIIAFRSHTRFNDPEQLLQVNGIGHSKLKQCKNLITTDID